MQPAVRLAPQARAGAASGASLASMRKPSGKNYKANDNDSLMDKGTAQKMQTAIPLDAVVDKEPIALECPYCGEFQTTTVTHHSRCGFSTRLWFAIIFAIAGCVCGCCLVPFFVDGLQEAEHKCSKCRRYLASHNYV